MCFRDRFLEHRAPWYPIDLSLHADFASDLRRCSSSSAPKIHGTTVYLVPVRKLQPCLNLYRPDQDRKSSWTERRHLAPLPELNFTNFPDKLMPGELNCTELMPNQLELWTRRHCKSARSMRVKAGRLRELNGMNWTELNGVTWPQCPELKWTIFLANWCLVNWTELNWCQTSLNSEREDMESSRTPSALVLMMTLLCQWTGQCPVPFETQDGDDGPTVITTASRNILSSYLCDRGMSFDGRSPMVQPRWPTISHFLFHWRRPPC